MRILTAVLWVLLGAVLGIIGLYWYLGRGAKQLLGIFSNPGKEPEGA